jgi:hypothetical protein
MFGHLRTSYRGCLSAAAIFILLLSGGQDAGAASKKAKRSSRGRGPGLMAMDPGKTVVTPAFWGGSLMHHADHAVTIRHYPGKKAEEGPAPKHSGKTTVYRSVSSKAPLLNIGFQSGSTPVGEGTSHELIGQRWLFAMDKLGMPAELASFVRGGFTRSVFTDKKVPYAGGGQCAGAYFWRDIRKVKATLLCGVGSGGSGGSNVYVIPEPFRDFGRGRHAYGFSGEIFLPDGDHSARVRRIKGKSWSPREREDKPTWDASIETWEGNLYAVSRFLTKLSKNGVKVPEQVMKNANAVIKDFKANVLGK